MTVTDPQPPAPVVLAVEARLDEPVTLVPAHLWAVLVAVTVAVAALVTWGVAGTWSRQVSLPAVIMHGSGPVAVLAPGEGAVTALQVGVGDAVAAGAPVATMLVGGQERPVVAPVAGQVVAEPVEAGDHVTAGSRVLTLDPSAAAPSATLLVTDAADLGRLSAGREVVLQSPAGVLVGRVSAVSAVPTTSAALRRRLAIPLTGLPASDQPVWLATVELAPGSRIGSPTQATAVVVLPSIHPYQVVFGGRS